MFVLASKYNNLVDEHLALSAAYYDLKNDWDALVERINKKGGEAFLNSNQPNNQFDKTEIRKLLSLCHPDKHNGRLTATEMTMKLIEIKRCM